MAGLPAENIKDVFQNVEFRIIKRLHPCLIIKKNGTFPKSKSERALDHLQEEHIIGAVEADPKISTRQRFAVYRVSPKELNDLKTELEKVKQENQTKHKEKEEMKKELNDMKIRVQRLEKERKVNNVVIQGLPIDKIDRNELKQTVGNFMEKETNINVQIEEVIKLGEKTCLLKLQNKFEKEKIMQNKAKLKPIKGNKVYINNDITKEELQTQKKNKTSRK
ncbi:girdin-like [Diabrotica virgifera virgifera]|uniref:Uncharacterized protein n=1 Tax=Diabrotica virgifera virgifera TaxID=50390 RepID=A0ABM5K5H2_DIAVI|nr:girdin-like [Diabrotica virgifera virgifera]